MFVLLSALTGYKIVEVAKRDEGRDTQITYITRRAIRMEFPTNGSAVIMRITKGGVKAYMLNLKDSTYTDLSPMAASFSTVYLAMFVRCKDNGKDCRIDSSVIRATDEYRKINGHRARKVIYYLRNLKGLLTSMGPALPDSIASWFVKDWKALYRAEVMRTDFLSEFTINAINDPQARSLVRRLNPFLKRLLKKYGAPIVTVSPFMGQVVEVTRISVRKTSMGESLFKVPEGFRKR